ncbi:MAG TPA: prolipoprotein diacylglyceryl transferase [Acidobacteriota bacterium]|nr:prolipoprotein diacylglyceryl transferase [Acidobacteriota bacterium]
MLSKLVELGPVTIHTYGVLLVTAYLTAIALTARLAEKDKVPRAYAWDLGFVVIISALIGAKLLMVASEIGTYLRDPSLFLSLDFWRAGGVFYGGFIGAVAGSAIYAWRNPQLPFWIMADAAAPAIALGQSIGRLGCFAAGCDYGRPADVPWAVTFTSEYARARTGVPLNIPLHPAQLYESFSTLLIFLFLLVLHRHKKFQGQVFAAYLIAYGIARFFLEFFRGDADRGFVFAWVSTSQFISLLIVPAGLALYWYRRTLHAAKRI